jgi:stearoyl-CoA desaturase (delta-9 desaturase)
MKKITLYFCSSTIGVQIYLIISLLFSLYGIVVFDVTLFSILLVFLGYFIYGCLGIVIAFHRNLTHKSFKTNSVLIKIFSILGCLGGTGSPLAWVAIHLNHHLNSDTPKDPHSPLYKGIRIFLMSYESNVEKSTKWRMKEIITDKFQQFLHRYYFLILISYDILLFFIFGLYALIFFHFIPLLITALMSNIVNYVGHSTNIISSSRTYNINDNSANNWLWAIPSWGESWHNNHHRFPKKYYFGEKWYQIDISGLIIKLIKY